ncbi:MAG: geranylgeranyl reductase family protein [Methanobacteriales archaeon]|nr:geranylgeranyl reductase family protein [Methanobacteriales archaeon]
MWDYDVLVLGAGPIGSTLARLLAEKDLKVGLVEKKSIIGLPLQCAGLVSWRIKEVNILPDEFIINRIKGAIIHSPSNHTLKISKDDVEAYVIDRISYDQYLAEEAVSNGVELLKNSKVTKVDYNQGKVTINGHDILSAPIIVDAMGFKPGQRGFKAKQYLVEFQDTIMDPEFLDLKIDANISPGFLWRIPLSETRARIGFFSESRKSWDFLVKFIKNFSPHFNILKRYYGNIPAPDPNRKLYKGRCIFIGDSAAQVKPTTGGGLILGFKAARIAAETIEEAINHDDYNILKKYHEKYHEIHDKEIKNQLRIQKTFKLLENDELDNIILKIKEKNLKDIIIEYGDMDNQTPLIQEFLKRGLLTSIIPSFIWKKVTKIWK